MMEYGVDLARHGHELRDHLGQGAMGHVFLVYSKRYNQLFAAKQIPQIRIKPQDSEQEDLELLSSRIHPPRFHHQPSHLEMNSNIPVQPGPKNSNPTQLTSKQTTNSNSTDPKQSQTTDQTIQKILHLASSDSKNEVTALMALNHPNIIKMYEVFEEGTYFYLILEYCENGTMKTFLGDKPDNRLYDTELFTYILQMTLAIQFCHSKKIAHRDIKPANFLLDNYNRVRLSDFGLSASLNNNEALENIRPCGSPAYMAPELLNYRHKPHNHQSFDVLDESDNKIDLYKADVWSLGITVYEMAVGCKPFMGTLDEIREQVQHSFEKPQEIRDQRLMKLLRGMLKVNPHLRFTINDILASEYFVKHGYVVNSSTGGGQQAMKRIQPANSISVKHQNVFHAASFKMSPSNISLKNNQKQITASSSFLKESNLPLVTKTSQSLLAFQNSMNANQQSDESPFQLNNQLPLTQNASDEYVNPQKSWNTKTFSINNSQMTTKQGAPIELDANDPHSSPNNSEFLHNDKMQINMNSQDQTTLPVMQMTHPTCCQCNQCRHKKNINLVSASFCIGPQHRKSKTSLTAVPTSTEMQMRLIHKKKKPQLNNLTFQ